LDPIPSKSHRFHTPLRISHLKTLISPPPGCSNCSLKYDKPPPLELGFRARIGRFSPPRVPFVLPTISS
jgi:hypothetical protein